MRYHTLFLAGLLGRLADPHRCEKMSTNHPADLRYATTHEWARLEGDWVVTGITDHAQAQMGDLVYVDVPAIGRQLTQGAPAGGVESFKTTSDIHAPVTGEVVAVNAALEDDPELVNRDPYGAGWIYKIRPSQVQPLDHLQTADQYVQGL